MPAGEIRHLDHNSPTGQERHECGSSAGLDWTKTKEHDMSTEPYSITTILGLIRTYGDLCAEEVGAGEHAGWDEVQEAKAKAAALLDDIANQLHHLEAHLANH